RPGRAAPRRRRSARSPRRRVRPSRGGGSAAAVRGPRCRASDRRRRRQRRGRWGCPGRSPGWRVRSRGGPLPGGKMGSIGERAPEVPTKRALRSATYKAGEPAMSAVCSRCSHVFDHAPVCPRCGLPLPAHESGLTPIHGPRWQQSAWGRILIGLILSQGLFYGLRHLTTGLLLAAEDASTEEMWSDVRILLILQGIQLFGVLVGGTLAGGGQRSGLFLGAVVGAWNGVLGVLLRQNPAQELTLVGLFGQPLLHAFVGSLGGAFGAL